MRELWPVWGLVEARRTRLGFLLALFVQMACILAPLYGATNHLMGWRGTTVWDPTTALDLAIPFMAWTVLVYLSLFYLFYPLPLFSMPDTAAGRREALLMCQGLVVLSLVSNLVFVLLPAEVHIRSQAFAAVDGMHPLILACYQMQWTLDTPYNAWPSLHVSQAALTTLFAIRWWGGRRLLQWGIGIGWVLMCISILTTKQHFVWDLLTGIVLVAVVWQVQMRPRLAGMGCLEDE